VWERNLDWITSPRRCRAVLATALAARKRAYALPKIRALVGDAPIDSFGYRAGWLLLNEMNYSPRPMPITFATSNAYLLRRNEAFYRDSTSAPRFILAELGSIDNRLVPVDDGLALGAILDDYHPLLRAHDLLLLQRNPEEQTRERVERPLLAERETGFHD